MRMAFLNGGFPFLFFPKRLINHSSCDPLSQDWREILQSGLDSCDHFAPNLVAVSS